MGKIEGVSKPGHTVRVYVNPPGGGVDVHTIPFQSNLILLLS